MRFFAAAVLFFGAAASYAQAPEVPRNLQFAGITLTIREDAQQEIQKDVNALTQYSRYYLLKVERARTYFPIIEKIFADEHVPDDFKYLVLQESALVPDAVSISNAVGFWQFKDFTAIEMGLRVDQEIDERMNLVSATRGAARYLKLNNTYFNNWLYALQAYQMGAGGVKRAVKDLQSGTKTMEINADTYWYVKKFLAHKIAFEPVCQGEPQVKVVPYETRRAKSLKEIASDVSSDEDILKEYNKWARGGLIPADKTYVVLIPTGKLDRDFNNLVLSSPKAPLVMAAVARKESVEEAVMINGIPTIRARSGETIAALADRAKVSISAFLRYNDIGIDHPVEPGALYLLGKKRTRASDEYYTVKPGDDLWSVSQRFGVQKRKLLSYNGLDDHEPLVIGSTLWLSATKKEDVMPAAGEGKEAQLSEGETFDWYLKVPRSAAIIPVPKTQPLPARLPQDSVPISHASVTQEALAPAAAQTYTVKQGDSFYSIARQYSVPVTSLLAWNDLTIQSPLSPGQRVRVAGERQSGPEVRASATPAQTIVHEVTSSDTLYSIARQFGVTIRDLMVWNNKKDLTLSVGEKLRIIQK
jgi:membrane-bound lytic murein transglycosylase D